MAPMAQGWGQQGGGGYQGGAAPGYGSAPAGGGGGSKTAYGYDMRVLSCAQCGAPVQGTLHGGTFQCGYCQAQNQLAPRDERMDHQVVQQAPQMTEAQRFERLRQQDGKPLMPPPSLQPYMQGGGLAEHMIPAVQDQWRMAKQEVGQGGGFQAAERLYFATLMLRGPLSKQGRDLEVRAMIETALEVLTEPRHRAVMHGFMARDATRLGDPEAGEKWLSLMPPQSDDLHIDSAFRITRAYVSTAKNDFNTVLQVLGQRRDDIPIADGQDELAAVMRANAFEKLGRGQEASAELQRIMVSPPHAQLVGKIIQSNAALGLCSHTYPQMAQQMQQMSSNVVKSKSGMNTGAIFIIAFLGAPLLIGAQFLIQGLGLPGWVFGIAVGAFVVTLLVYVFGSLTRGARIKAKLKQNGVRGQATLVQCNTTGTRVNNQPVYELILTIEAQGLQPFRASHREILAPGAAHKLQPGVVLPLLLDPKDPTMFAIDW